jgi:hypothetical protein
MGAAWRILSKREAFEELNRQCGAAGIMALRIESK